MAVFNSFDILVPKTEYMEKWPVVACDQFTSQPEYWQRVEERVGDAPSALNLILPESKLEQPDVAQRIKAIEATVRDRLSPELRPVEGSGITYFYKKHSERDGWSEAVAAARKQQESSES